MNCQTLGEGLLSTVICKGQPRASLVPTAIIMEWRKENRCFLSIHKAFNFSMYSDLSLSLSLSLFPFSLYISKFPFYIQRHYRKAFNSSHNVLCIWILKEEMETFFAAAFTPPAKEGKKSFFFSPGAKVFSKLQICFWRKI